MPQFLPGDLVFVRRRSLMGRLIAWFERRPGEGPTYATHCALTTETGLIIEALWTVQERSLAHLGRDIQVWRLQGLADAQHQAVVEAARAFLGRRYGVLKLLVHGLDAALTKLAGREVYALRRLLGWDRYPICSWVPAHAYAKAAGYRFGGQDPDLTDPDQMHDVVSTSPEWGKVF